MDLIVINSMRSRGHQDTCGDSSAVGKCEVFQSVSAHRNWRIYKRRTNQRKRTYLTQALSFVDSLSRGCPICASSPSKFCSTHAHRRRPLFLLAAVWCTLDTRLNNTQRSWMSTSEWDTENADITYHRCSVYRSKVGYQYSSCQIWNSFKLWRGFIQQPWKKVILAALIFSMITAY